MTRPLLFLSLIAGAAWVGRAESAILPGGDMPKTFINERFTCYLFSKYAAVTDNRMEAGQRVTQVFPKISDDPKKACRIAADGRLLEISQTQDQFFLGVYKDLMFIQYDRDHVPTLTIFNFKEKRKVFEAVYVPDLPFFVENRSIHYYQFPASISPGSCADAGEAVASEWIADLTHFKVKASGKTQCAFPPMAASVNEVPQLSTPTVPTQLDPSSRDSSR